MPNPYAGVDSFPTTIDVVDDGDPPEAATWAPADEGNRDAVVWLRARLPGGELSEEVPIPIVPGPGTTVNFTFDSPQMEWRQNSVASAGVIFIELTDILPKKCTLKQIEFFFDGAAGHAAFPGGAPATMPKLTLYRKNVQTQGNATTVATQSDTSATAAIYEAVHAVAITGLTEAIANNNDNRYFLTIEGETGANSIVGLLLLGGYAIVDRS